MALNTLPDGDLVAGGYFSHAGGAALPWLARWDGVAWSSLGAGVNGAVRALTRLPNGDLVVGGQFTMAGGAPASFVARWDGSAWHPMGTGTNDWVTSLATLPNCDVVAGGSFTMAGGNRGDSHVLWRLRSEQGLPEQFGIAGEQLSRSSERGIVLPATNARRECGVRVGTIEVPQAACRRQVDLQGVAA